MQTDVYTPNCERCGVRMTVLLTTARCYNRRCGTVADPMKRASRVVGRIPEIWAGASAAKRVYEGRSVRMVLNPDEVPIVGKVMHQWLTIDWCFAHDFDFTTKPIRDKIEEGIRTHSRWKIDVTANRSRDALESMFRNEYVLLLVD